MYWRKGNVRFFTEHLLCEGLVGSSEAPAKRAARDGAGSLDGSCPGDPERRAQAPAGRDCGWEGAWPVP